MWNVLRSPYARFFELDVPILVTVEDTFHGVVFVLQKDEITLDGQTIEFPNLHCLWHGYLSDLPPALYEPCDLEACYNGKMKKLIIDKDHWYTADNVLKSPYGQFFIEGVPILVTTEGYDRGSIHVLDQGVVKRLWSGDLKDLPPAFYEECNLNNSSTTQTANDIWFARPTASKTCTQWQQPLTSNDAGSTDRMARLITIFPNGA